VSAATRPDLLTSASALEFGAKLTLQVIEQVPAQRVDVERFGSLLRGPVGGSGHRLSRLWAGDIWSRRRNMLRHIQWRRGTISKGGTLACQRVRLLVSAASPGKAPPLGTGLQRCRDMGGFMDKQAESGVVAGPVVALPEIDVRPYADRVAQVSAGDVVGM
jgi:hypothetical protein